MTDADGRAELGYCLNRLIAEDVMGVDLRKTYWDDEEQRELPVRGQLPEPYSTDIAAAWKVVERMRELGFAIFSVQRDEFTGDGYQAMFGNGTRFYGRGLTAAEAISSAAHYAVTETKAREGQ